MTKFEVAGIVLWLGGIAFGLCIARARDMKPAGPYLDRDQTRWSGVVQDRQFTVALDDITFDWPEHPA